MASNYISNDEMVKNLESTLQSSQFRSDMHGEFCILLTKICIFFTEELEVSAYNMLEILTVQSVKFNTCDNSLIFLLFLPEIKRIKMHHCLFLAENSLGDRPSSRLTVLTVTK